MRCAREECREAVIPCRSHQDTGSCWYALCRGYTHANQRHSCADRNGDAHPGEA